PARRSRDPAPDHPALPSPHQREGQALPPDHAARVGQGGLSTARIDSATRRCQTGSSTTTGTGPTAPSETVRRSAAFTTSVGRTATQGNCAFAGRIANATPD